MIAKYHVTYDSHNGDSPNQLCVHKADGQQRKFNQSQRGLFYLYTAKTENYTVLAVNTVEHNKFNYAVRDYNRAKLARKIQVLVGRPELKDFLRYLDGNSFPNCPINRQDAINAHAIFGRDIGSIKGKTTRRKLKGILGSVANNLPKEIMETYRDVTLCIDIMFVNKIPFFLSISRIIRFITVEVLDNRKQASLIKALQHIYGIYRKRGFRISNILGDSEFECTRGAVATDLRSKLNICGEDEHVPDIERCIRTLKERTRCIYNVTPFDHFPPRMIIEMVFLSVFWMNAFPHKLGVSQTLSPRTIVTSLGIDYDKHCHVEYGQYVQTHGKHDNTMTPRTIGALALRPTGNQQGGYYFYSLMSGQRLYRTHWTELPMPAEVKDRVHGLARRSNAHQGLTFRDGHGNNLDALYSDDDDDDSDYDPNNADSTSSASSDDSTNSDSDFDPDAISTSSSKQSDDAPDSTNIHDLAVPMPDEIEGADPTINTVEDDNPPGEIPGVDDETNDHLPGEIPGLDDEPTTDSLEPPGVDPHLETYVNELKAELDQGIADLDSDYIQDESDDESTRADATREQASANYDANNGTDNNNNGVPALLPRLRRNRTPNYGHMKGRDGDGSLPTLARPEEFRGGCHQSHVILQSIIMTQYNLKQGIKKFGDLGKAAVLTELQQLYDRDVMRPVNKCDLTPAERKGALRYLMFLKRKALRNHQGPWMR
jgi:hypothetical protein